MAEQNVPVVPQVKVPEPKVPVPAPKKRASKIEQDIHVGDNVTLNGTLYTVTGGKYDWTMECPRGSHAALMNPTMPGPSFVPDMEGEYTVLLSTDDGVEEVVFHVSE